MRSIVEQRHRSRQHRIAQRLARNETIAERTRHLPPSEATLLNAVCRDGVRYSQLSALLGEPAHRVRHRAVRVMERMLDPRFDFVVSRRAAWPPQLRAVANALYINGWTLRRTATQLNLKLSEVRRQRDTIEGLYQVFTCRGAVA